MAADAEPAKLSNVKVLTKSRKALLCTVCGFIEHDIVMFSKEKANKLKSIIFSGSGRPKLEHFMW